MTDLGQEDSYNRSNSVGGIHLLSPLCVAHQWRPLVHSQGWAQARAFSLLGGLAWSLAGREPLMGAGCLGAYTAVRLLMFLGWPVTCVASKCSNLRPQIIFCSAFLLCMFDSVALFIFLKYFLLVCVSWHGPAMVFLKAIFSRPPCRS